jgi:hypothetical protein
VGAGDRWTPEPARRAISGSEVSDQEAARSLVRSADHHREADEPDEQDKMSIQILTGRTIHIKVNASDNVGALKEAIQDAEGFEADHLELSLGTRVLLDPGKTLRAWGISHATEIRLRITGCGGVDERQREGDKRAENQREEELRNAIQMLDTIHANGGKRLVDGGRPPSSRKRKKHVTEDHHYVPTAHEPERYNRCTNYTLPVGDVARRFEAMAAITKLLYLLGRPGPGTGTPVWMTDATCMQILWSKGTSTSAKAQFQLHTTTGRICGGAPHREMRS